MGEANKPPPKPWERAGVPSGSSPFKPPSTGSTNDVVEASGTAKPAETVASLGRNAMVNNRTSVRRPIPVRPWEYNYDARNYGGLYGSYGGLGETTYNGLYQGGGFGGIYGPGMYGGGMYNGGFGGPVGGYRMGMDGPYRAHDPSDPHGAPSSPPGFWISLLQMMQRVVNCFGHISILIDQHTQALHTFMSALLQLFDLSGMLYGELARFVFRLLGFRKKRQKVDPPGPTGLSPPAPENQHQSEGTKTSPSRTWDIVWENDAKK
ncbi:hypothetical protein JCGZ_20919 [Jatropha curcas]|uniref:Uncharacterized protein n=1 Tax=Jatropha curcas TaxID=180498 RepID=A0A067LI52_JATCU|nr:peroxisomal membrane protein 13 [Jatropha curcas]KDP43909.1 hypothetical protein JCGZ_20919 [Jatropha curcas]